ncbi:hypothetical protein JCM11641_006102 [Rhodosporidiobolus odoratus]
MISEYTSALPLLEAALAELSIGQVVREESYPMSELMSAIEINDPRTDTCLHALNLRKDQNPPLPPFDAAMPLTPEEVLWVNDEVVRLEATFHRGHPLPSTLWTCNYLRPASLQRLCFPPPMTSPSARQIAEEKLRTVVLRALLLGTIKCGEIVFEELGRGKIYEHEDAHLHLSSLSFPALLSSCFPPLPPPPSPSRLALPGQSRQQAEEPQERVVSVDDVLRALDEAQEWVEGEEAREVFEGLEDGDRVREESRERIAWRIDLLYPLALLTAPSLVSPTLVSAHLARLSSHQCPSHSTFSPSPSLRSAFNPSASVPLLPTQQPPRPVDILSRQEAYDELTGKLAGQLEGLVRLWEDCAKREGEGVEWSELERFCREVGRKASERSPYIRSLTQSIISPTPSLLLTHPSNLLTGTFLSHLSGLSPLFFSRISVLPPSPTTDSLLAWSSRLATTFLLPTTSSLSSQNRGRQRRIVLKSLARMVESISEVEREILPRLIQVAPMVGAEGRDVEALKRVPGALGAHALEMVHEALLSGLEREVELFVEAEEKKEVYWVGAEVAKRLEGVYGMLLRRGEEEASAEIEGEKGLEYSRRKLEEVRATREMCRGSFLMHTLSPSSPPKFSSPFLPSLSSMPASASSTSARKGRFIQRFGWLDKLTQSPTLALSSCRGLAAFEEFEKEGKRVEGLSTRHATLSLSTAQSNLSTLNTFLKHQSARPAHELDESNTKTPLKESKAEGTGWFSTWVLDGEPSI